MPITYTRSRQVFGRDLTPGMWLDSLDHRGARMIYGVAMDPEQPIGFPLRQICFGFYFRGYDTDTETVRADVQYDVVDPDSIVEGDDPPALALPPGENTEY